jgi:hypothetical protein
VDVKNIQYTEDEAELGVTCEVEANPPAQVYIKGKSQENVFQKDNEESKEKNPPVQLLNRQPQEREYKGACMCI